MLKVPLDPRYEAAEEVTKESEEPVINMTVVDHMLQLPGLNKDKIIEVTFFV